MTDFIIPMEGSEGAVLTWPILVASILVVLLAILSSIRMSQRATLSAPLCVAASVILGAGAAMFVHDAVAFSGIIALSAIGASVGYLIGRQIKIVNLSRYGTLFLALAGASGSLSASSALLNPTAFAVTELGLVLLPIAIILGAAITIIGLFQFRKNELTTTRSRFLLAGLIGAVATACGFALGSLPLIMSGGFTVSYCFILTLGTETRA